MANILRQIREKAGLSQREVALRMGIKSKSGRSFIAQLEIGRIKNPTLRTIFDYLHACGASASREFFTKLETIDFQNRHKQVIAQIKLQEGKEKKKIERDVAWFEAGIKYPRKITQKPLSTKKQEEMAIEFAKYRIKIEKVEAEVHKILCDFAPGTYSFPFYKDCARAFFSALVKYYGKDQKKLNKKLTEIIQLGKSNGLKENILLRIKEKVVSVFKSQIGKN
ncbi:MAG: helix-turn-helix domain-containing protein [candidate division WOR-3 bacterium]|nr:helix-turn-helix domain-containing protein [candidate division WOR-3 bacterium]MDH5683600.1 helix-turn-helix domain-containing protein [candidate division WOR-3 bacterium]